MLRRLSLPVAMLAILTLLVVAFAPLHSTDAQTDSRYFPETHHFVKGLFLKYWNEHGGLAQQGYPLTEEFQEVNKLDGKTYTVQYFERAIFERHPENAGTPYEVLLSQLGKFELDARYPNGSNPAAAPVSGSGGGGQPTAPPAPTQPAASGKVDIIQTANYKDSIGSLWFVGVAKNNTGKDLSGVQIVLTLLDSSNKTLATADSNDYDTALIHPGDLLPFKILVNNGPGTWANVQWQTSPKSYDPNSYTGKSLYRALSFQDVSLQAPSGVFGNWTVVGQVKNTGSATAQFINVRAAIYDAGGSLLDVSDAYTKLDTLAPGDTSPFEVEFLREGINPAKQDVFVDARVK